MQDRAWNRAEAALGACVLSFAILGVSIWATSAAAQERLESYAIDSERVSVSGISSGAFMANQLHIAHSESIMGAGIVAGGLYGCAAWRINTRDGRLDATLSRAFDRCMEAKAPLEPVETYAGRIEDLAEAGWLDPVDGLAGDRVYLFTGRADTTVDPGTVETAAALYQALGVTGDDLDFQKFLDDPPEGAGAGHSWVTDDCCQVCEANETPFINDCDYDQAESILRHIYGPLEPQSDSLSGDFVEFSQSEFAPEGQTAINGLLDSGWLYVPEACAEGETCALHVVLHGCKQSTEFLGDTFYKSIGVNEWADANGIVVLYPQAKLIDRAMLDEAYPERTFRNSLAVNPFGCWNWWGYGYDERFALKEGVQIRALHAMIRRITGADAE